MFLDFMIHNYMINLPAYIFHYMCTSIKEGITKRIRNVPYVRLLSEIFHQGRLIEKLRHHGLVSDKEIGTCT
jgi:hypothetical protein